MELAELLQAWGPLTSVVLAPLATMLVQLAKRNGLDPFFALGLTSAILAAIYVVVGRYAPEQWVNEGLTVLTLIGGTATVIYNVAKKFYPSLGSNS